MTDAERAFNHCANMDRCWDIWSERCPDGRLAEPHEWLRCSYECANYSYCATEEDRYGKD